MKEEEIKNELLKYLNNKSAPKWYWTKANAIGYNHAIEDIKEFFRIILLANHKEE